MDKSCHSSGESTTTSSGCSSNVEHRLRQLNKISHKVSKPIRASSFDHHRGINHQPPPPPLPPPPPPQPQMQSQPQNLQQQQQHQHQPPVYNINKSDFREVVQKLTGSPAHERFSTPLPIQPSKPPSSRLQRIRPPPLAHVGNRPPPLLNNAVAHPQPPPAATINPSNPVSAAAGVRSGGFVSNQRPMTPLSPLPPFPAVHAAAESPISAYMRFLQGSVSTVDSDLKRFPTLAPLEPLVSPRWNILPQSQLPQHQQQVLPPQQNTLPSPTSASMAQSPFLIPSSPLPFGCLPSPRSPYPLLSPKMLFSPNTAGQLGFQQFPVSPRLSVPSPRWKDL